MVVSWKARFSIEVSTEVAVLYGLFVQPLFILLVLMAFADKVPI